MQKTRKIISKTVLVLAAFSAFSIVGCEKDEDTPPTKEQMLSVHNWKIQSLTVPSVNAPGTDSSIIQTCDTESILAFSSLYSYQFTNSTPGGCSGTRFFYDNGTWTYNNSDDSLHLDGGTRDYAWKVNTLTDTSLVASYMDSISPTFKWSTKIVLKNQ